MIIKRAQCFFVLDLKFLTTQLRMQLRTVINGVREDNLVPLEGAL